MSIVTIRRVYVDGDGADEPLNVELDDTGSAVRVVTSTDEAREYWGHIDFVMPIGMARELAEALIACASDANNG